MDTDVVKKKRGGGGGGGFTKPCALSPQLEEFLGVAVLARTEVSHWRLFCRGAHVKKNISKTNNMILSGLVGCKEDLGIYTGAQFAEPEK